MTTLTDKQANARRWWNECTYSRELDEIAALHTALAALDAEIVGRCSPPEPFRHVDEPVLLPGDQIVRYLVELQQSVRERQRLLAEAEQRAREAARRASETPTDRLAREMAELRAENRALKVANSCRDQRLRRR